MSQCNGKVIAIGEVKTGESQIGYLKPLEKTILVNSMCI